MPYNQQTHLGYSRSLKSPESEGEGGRHEWKAWEGVVPQYLRYGCFAWQFIKFTAIFFLCIRQHRVLSKHLNIPRVFYGKLPQETFERAREYQMSLNYLKMFSCFYWILHEVWVILYTGFTYIWFLSGPCLNFLGFWPREWDQETGESIVFICLLVLEVNISQLPLDLWKTFVIEEKYEFNKMTLLSFLLDLMKKILFETVFSVVTGICILWIVWETGRWFFMWLWMFSLFWLLVTLAVYPHFIAPIFDTYTPLRDGRLKRRLQKLANFLGFPLEDVLVLHQGWRSEHRHSYFYGLLGSKRIVLYDTLLAGYPEADEDNKARRRTRVRTAIPKKGERSESLESIPSRILIKGHVSQLDSGTEVPTSSSSSSTSKRVGKTAKSRASIYERGFTEYEIEALVARLMGHWVLGHSVRELIFPVICTLLFFLLFSYVYQNSSLFQAFSVPRGMDKPVLLGLRLLYADVMDVYIIFVESVMKHLNRQRFYEADAFATKLGYGEDLIDAYIEAEKENLDYPYFDTLYWNYHFHEPSVLQSINAIEKEIERMQWKVD